MKKTLLVLSMTVLLLSAGCGSNSTIGLEAAPKSVTPAIEVVAPVAPSVAMESSKNETNRLKAKVTRVVDGDTLEIDLNGKKETVRLVLVDTPETKHPTKPVQPFGKEASEFTKSSLEGKDITLEKDVTERDRYGRLLMYVYLGDKMFNETLLEQGLARVAVYQPDVKYIDKFRALQKKAQESGIGIWSIENYASEKGYNDSVESPAPKAVEPKSVPIPVESQSNQTVSYGSCKEVKAAGKAPIHKGDPGYSTKLDRDGDGVACE
jgi:micrococcal nuclease